MDKCKRIYELWPGKNRFFLKGFLITGPSSDLPVQASVYLLLLVSLGLYVYFILPKMLHTSLILAIGYFTLFLTTITLMFLTSHTDPGVIPRRPFLEMLQHQIQSSSNYNYQSLLQTQQYQRLIYLLYQASDPYQVFCCSCHIYRPGNASHCSRCNSCYLGIDHHCPWLGTCVAKNNYRTFLAFLASIVALIVVMGLNILQFVSEEVGEGKQEGNNEMIYIVICCALVGALVVVLLGFFIFHLTLICRGKTTRQLIKEKKNKKVAEQSASKSNAPESEPCLEESLVSSTKNMISEQSGQQITTESSVKPKKVNEKFLDSFINNHYQDTHIFYKELFQTRQSIHLIDFRQELIGEDLQFIEKGLVQLKEKKEKMVKQGARYEYYKQVIAQ